MKIVILTVGIVLLAVCAMGALLTAAAMNELGREVSHDE